MPLGTASLPFPEEIWSLFVSDGSTGGVGAAPGRGCSRADVSNAEISAQLQQCQQGWFALGQFVLRMFPLLSPPSCFVICKHQKPNQCWLFGLWIAGIQQEPCVSGIFLSVLASFCYWKSEGISVCFPRVLAAKAASVRWKMLGMPGVPSSPALEEPCPAEGTSQPFRDPAEQPWGFVPAADPG